MADEESYDFRLFFARIPRAGAAASGILNRQMQGCRAALVSHAAISLLDEERPNGGGATGSHGAVEGRYTIFIFRTRIGASPNQELHDGILCLGVPSVRPRNPIGRVVEGFAATSVSDADACTFRYQLLGDISLIARGCDVQCGGAPEAQPLAGRCMSTVPPCLRH